MLKKGIVILSGGLDSTTLLHFLRKHSNYDLIALSFSYGQNHLEELQYAQLNAEKLGVKHFIIDLNSIYANVQNSSALLSGASTVPTIQETIGDPQPITYVPFRNSLMLTVAAIHAEAFGIHDIFYGAQVADSFSGYWDVSQSFLQKLNDLFSENRKNKIHVKAPFVNLSKSDIIQIGTLLGVDYSKTMTCYKGDPDGCGVCPTCSDRIANFAKLGVKDPLSYHDKLDWSYLIAKHKTQIRLVEEILADIKE